MNIIAATCFIFRRVCHSMGARRTQMFCTPKAFTSLKKKCLESLHFIEYVTPRAQFKLYKCKYYNTHLSENQ